MSSVRARVFSVISTECDRQDVITILLRTGAASSGGDRRDTDVRGCPGSWGAHPRTHPRAHPGPTPGPAPGPTPGPTPGRVTSIGTTERAPGSPEGPAGTVTTEASSPASAASSTTPTATPDPALEETWTTDTSSTQKREEPKGGTDQVAKEQHQVAILKQINRVNEDGSYTFGYEAADGSFKIETRDVLGHVKGMFGFIDEHGQLKRVSYTAANGTGFQTGLGGAGAAGAAGAAPTPSERPVTRSSSRRPVLILRRPAQDPEQDEEDSSTGPLRFPDVIQQIPRRSRPSVVTVLPRRDLIPTNTPTTLTPSSASTASSRRPSVLLSTPNPQPDGSTPTPAPYGQYVTRGPSSTDSSVRPGTVLVLTGAPSGRRVLVTRKPQDGGLPVTIPTAPVVEETTPEPTPSKEGNDLRRQLSPDRDIDPVGLIPGGGQLLKLRQPGSADTSDVYGGGTGGLRLGHGSALGLGNAPYVGILQNQAHQAAQTQQQLQKHILGDVDLTPRPRYPDYNDPGAPARARPLPPLQLEPNVAKALEQFLLSRGIRLRPLDPARDPYARPPAPAPAPAPPLFPPVPHPRFPARPRYHHPMAYRGYQPPPYYDDGYDYDPYPHHPRASAGYPMPYSSRPAYGYDPGYDPVYQPGYHQPPAYSPYQPYTPSAYNPQPLFVPLRPYSRRAEGGSAPAASPAPSEQSHGLAGSPSAHYTDVALPEDLRQELLLRMLLGARAQVQSQDYDAPGAANVAGLTAEATTAVPTVQQIVTTSSRVRNVKILSPEPDPGSTTARPTSRTRVTLS